MTLEEKIWDAFTDLGDNEMADMAERACGVEIFRMVSMSEAMGKYNLDLLQFAEMLNAAIDNADFDTNDEWVIYHDFARTIESGNGLMDLLADHEDEIVDAIMEDPDLMEELEIEEDDDDYDNDDHD